MVKYKPSCPPEGNELKKSIEKSYGQSLKYNKYRNKKTQTKSQDQEPKAVTDFKGRRSDLED